jgi:hypothetical protein
MGTVLFLIQVGLWFQLTSLLESISSADAGIIFSREHLACLRQPRRPAPACLKIETTVRGLSEAHSAA